MINKLIFIKLIYLILNLLINLKEINPINPPIKLVTKSVPSSPPLQVIDCSISNIKLDRIIIRIIFLLSNFVINFKYKPIGI